MATEWTDRQQGGRSVLPYDLLKTVRMSKRKLEGGTSTGKQGLLEQIDGSSIAVGDTTYKGLTEASLPLWDLMFVDAAKKKEYRDHVQSEVDELRRKCRPIVPDAKMASSLQDAERSLHKFRNLKAEDVKRNFFVKVKDFMMRNPEYLMDFQDALDPLKAESRAVVENATSMVEKTRLENERLRDSYQRLEASQNLLAEEVGDSRHTQDVLAAKLRCCEVEQKRTIATLSEKVRLLERENDRLETKNAEHVRLQEELRENWNKSVEDYTKSNDDLSSLESTINDVCDGLGFGPGLACVQQILYISAEILRQKEKVEYWRQRAKESESHNDQAAGCAEAWRNSHANRLGEVSKANDNFSQISKENHSLKTDKRRLEERIDDLEALHGKIKSYNATISYLQNNLQECNKKKLGDAEEINKLKKSLNEKTNLCDVNANQSRELLQENERLRCSEEGLISSRSALTLQAQNLKTDFKEMRNVLSNLTIMNSGLNIQKRKLERYQMDFENCSANNTELNRLLDESNDLKTKATNDVQELKASLETADQKHLELSVQKRELEKKMQQAVHEHYTSELEKTRLQDTHAGCHAQIESLKTELSNENATKNKLAKSLEESELSNEAKSRAANTYRDRFDEVKTEVRKLRDEHTKLLESAATTRKNTKLLEAILHQKMPHLSEQLQLCQLLLGRYHDKITEGGLHMPKTRTAEDSQCYIHGLVPNVSEVGDVFTIGLRVFDMAVAEKSQVSGYLISVLDHSLRGVLDDALLFGLCVLVYIVETFDQKFLDQGCVTDWRQRVVFLQAVEILMTCTTAPAFQTKVFQIMSRLKLVTLKMDILSLAYISYISERHQGVESSLHSILFNSDLSLSLGPYRLLGDGSNIIVANEDNEIGLVQPHQVRSEISDTFDVKLWLIDAPLLGTKLFTIDELTMALKLLYFSNGHDGQDADRDLNIDLVVDF